MLPPKVTSAPQRTRRASPMASRTRMITMMIQTMVIRFSFVS
jgi:hypothetical protein